MTDREWTKTPRWKDGALLLLALAVSLAIWWGLALLCGLL